MTTIKQKRTILTYLVSIAVKYNEAVRNGEREAIALHRARLNAARTVLQLIDTPSFIAEERGPNGLICRISVADRDKPEQTFRCNDVDTFRANAIWSVKIERVKA